jgi:hypothetical protein
VHGFHIKTGTRETTMLAVLEHEQAILVITDEFTDQRYLIRDTEHRMESISFCQSLEKFGLSNEKRKRNC